MIAITLLVIFDKRSSDTGIGLAQTQELQYRRELLSIYGAILAHTRTGPRTGSLGIMRNRWAQTITHGGTGNFGSGTSGHSKFLALIDSKLRGNHSNWSI
jgi:hypothetical protein